MTIAEALRAAAQRLTPTSGTARLDAELLMAHALEVSRSDLLLRHMTAPPPDAFTSLIDRRSTCEPIAYIIGEQEFYGRSFAVTPDVLIPRPDSETLVDAALELAPAPQRVLDLGTGSGALLLSVLAERSAAQGIGVDASAAALAIARSNGDCLIEDSRCDFLCRDWRESGWRDGLGQFDLILCNPPYVETDAELDADVRDYEPAMALFSGSEGLDDYRILIPQIRSLLTADGCAIFEIGATQAESVAAIAASADYVIEIRHDLANRPRAIVLR